MQDLSVPLTLLRQKSALSSHLDDIKSLLWKCACAFFSSPALVISFSSEFPISILIFVRTVNYLKCSYLPEANLYRLGLKSKKI